MPPSSPTNTRICIVRLRSLVAAPAREKFWTTAEAVPPGDGLLIARLERLGGERRAVGRRRGVVAGAPVGLAGIQPVATLEAVARVLLAAIRQRRLLVALAQARGHVRGPHLVVDVGLKRIGAGVRQRRRPGRGRRLGGHLDERAAGQRGGRDRARDANRGALQSPRHVLLDARGVDGAAVDPCERLGRLDDGRDAGRVADVHVTDLERRRRRCTSPGASVPAPRQRPRAAGCDSATAGQ